MKYAVLVTRILLGLAFVVFGANIILHFLPQPPMAGSAALYMQAIGTNGYMKVVGILQIVGGLLLLVGRFIPLGLTLLGPIVFNILLFHVFLEPSGIPVAVLTVVLWGFLFFAYRASFAGIFAADPLAATSV